MSKPALIIIIILVVLIIVFGVFYLVTRPEYGNDSAGVQSLIQKNGGSGEMILLLDAVNMAGNRYVGFIEGENTLGLIVLVNDNRGNYLFENIYRKENMDLAVFYEPFNVEVAGTHGADIVVSRNLRLNKIVRLVDGAVEDEYPVEAGKPAVIAMEFHSTETALNVQIECYDTAGALIEY